MLWTTIAFVALAAFLLWRQASRGRGARTAGDARSCPRCGAVLHGPVGTCPRCRAPLSAFDIVAARPAVDAAGGGTGRPHAIVRADVCVGCGVCVPACPVPGAITMTGKLAVVDLALCQGHGRCAEACPTQAIVVSTGGTSHRVEVPDVDTDFQSNVPGIYIVGELGGRGLIKTAINEGRLAVESIARRLPPGAPRSDGDEGAVDVAIVGSGPAGLSAALEAHASGLSYVVLEQGTLADTVQRYPRHKLLLAEPVTIPLYGELWIADATKETLVEVWKNIVERTGLVVHTHQRVLDLARAGRVFDIETGKGRFRARTVVLAMGRRGTPRRLGVPGEELPKVVYDVVEMSAFAGRRARASRSSMARSTSPGSERSPLAA